MWLATPHGSAGLPQYKPFSKESHTHSGASVVEFIPNLSPNPRRNRQRALEEVSYHPNEFSGLYSRLVTARHAPGSTKYDTIYQVNQNLVGRVSFCFQKSTAPLLLEHTS